MRERGRWEGHRAHRTHGGHERGTGIGLGHGGSMHVGAGHLHVRTGHWGHARGSKTRSSNGYWRRDRHQQPSLLVFADHLADLAAHAIEVLIEKVGSHLCGVLPSRVVVFADAWRVMSQVNVAIC